MSTPAPPHRRHVSTIVRRLDRRLYPGVEDHWDDRLFRQRVEPEIRAGDRLLDLGAGAGVVPWLDFRGLGAQVIGVDPDRRVLDNPHLDEARIGVAEQIPYPDASFDLVIAANLLEHLQVPHPAFREVARVLRPGGRFLAKTPNRRHYVPLIATLTPHRFHKWVARQRGRREEDTFPTFYRANTRGRIEALARGAGLAVRDLELVESRPEYLRRWPLAYLLGWAYERAVNGFGGRLAELRVLLLIALEKRA